MRWLALLLLVAGCARGPDEAALKKEVAQIIDKSFKPGVLELVALKRQGSSPLGAERVLVYYNATLRLREGYDFKDWEALSPASLAQALGGNERGVFGVKAKENQPGDLLRVYGSGIYERSGGAWVVAAPAASALARAPAEPGNAAPSSDSKRYLDRLTAQVEIGPPGIDAQSDKIISEELDRALRAINRRRARTNELLTFAAGPADGEYARVVDAMLGTVAKRGRKVHVISVETEGSIENAFLVGRAQADFAVLQSDVAWLATTGAGPFAVDGPMKRIVAVGSLYPEAVHLVVSASSTIRSVQDLRGKRVDLGLPQSGTRLNALSVLQAHGVAAKELAETRGQGAQAAMQQLRAGRLDAFFTTIGAPTRELQRLAAQHAIRLVSLTPDAIARLVAEQPGLVRLTLPANTYLRQSEPVATIATTALLVAAADTPDDEVKALMNVAYEATDYLAAGSAQGVKISKASARRGVAIPLHPAAAAYFATPKP